MRASSMPRVSAHAVERWQQRVERQASAETARSALHTFIRNGTSRSTPRRWMKDVRQTPGLRYVYSHEYPGVCVLVTAHTALTVVTKSLCGSRAQLRRVRPRSGGRPHRRPRLEDARSTRWYAEDGEEAA